MAYLTQEEYKVLEFETLAEDNFKLLEKRASSYLDSQTRNYYQLNDLEQDIPFRRDKFKLAVALQIEYMVKSGATTSYDINTPQTWSIGRTSVSESSRYSNTGKNEAPSIICEDAILALSGTGLLGRGLSC